MKIPNSPAELIKGRLDSVLERLGDDVTIPTADLKRIMDGYWEAMEIVSLQRDVINDLINDD